jgi:hypothetical protein
MCARRPQAGATVAGGLLPGIVQQCPTKTIRPSTTMKKLICMFALILGASTFAQAQVYFGSGSARPINPGAATREVDRQPRVHPPAKARERVVHCRDGARRPARLCRRHGGVAR